MTFDQFVEQAWADHAAKTAGVAEQLKDFAGNVRNQDHIPDLVSLITHVFGEHLGDWSGGIAQLERLQGQADSAENRNAIFRSISALRLAGGFADNVDDLLASDQIRVLCVASAALSGQKQTERAYAYFADALRLAQETLSVADPACRTMAVTGNNLAAELESRKDRTGKETEFMIRAARAGLKYWLLVGEWPQHQRAHYRLSKCLLAAGLHVEALEEGMSCLAICKNHGAGPYDLFWANEAVASVIHVSKPSAFVDYLRNMRQCFEDLELGEKSFCEERLNEMESSGA